MKHVLLILLTTALFSSPGISQERIYRCGNEYTNTLQDAQARGCKLIEGGNLTVVKSTRPAATANAAAPVRQASASPTAGQRVDPTAQRERDSDARLILESELRKAETRQAELLKEYNNGEPEKMGSEARNYQKYLDRVAEYKASLARNESDIAGIRRELERLPGANERPSASK
ncbi:MAG: hypothetical protein KJ852_13690 [Gammaproteobacteria bacterium]|nr:hypothetical protein [Gammaproteobacteria bacterium]MBU0787116.1 hypothetical protein [Gammaproteobacteria bacterium]MBU0816367.1 hypothetical protein [Gammaproteobacteria bacterium]MBU1788004.1 hypothetical protein [Gammaproteobacteria bacterium]